MSITQQINDKTSFVLGSGELVPVEQALEIETEHEEEMKLIRLTPLAEDEGWMLVPSFIKEREAQIYDTMVQFVMDRVDEYLCLKHDNTKEEYNKTRIKNFREDILTSSLLRRLLEGKKPLPVPPPKTFEYGWYELVEEGEDICMEVIFVFPFENQITNIVPYVTIDGKRWEIESGVKGDEEFVVRYHDSNHIFKLTLMTNDDYNRLLHPRLKKSISTSKYSWKLTRMEQDGSTE